jgi:hypothetical protein
MNNTSLNIKFNNVENGIAVCWGNGDGWYLDANWEVQYACTGKWAAVVKIYASYVKIVKVLEGTPPRGIERDIAVDLWY